MNDFYQPNQPILDFYIPFIPSIYLPTPTVPLATRITTYPCTHEIEKEENMTTNKILLDKINKLEQKLFTTIEILENLINKKQKKKIKKEQELDILQKHPLTNTMRDVILGRGRESDSTLQKLANKRIKQKFKDMGIIKRENIPFCDLGKHHIQIVNEGGKISYNCIKCSFKRSYDNE
jgi:hypothetical protein